MNYMVDDITIIKSAGYDSWREPLASSEVEVKGKWEYKTKLVKDLKGEEVVSSASVLLPESIDTALTRGLTHEDLLKYAGIEHAIIAIERPKAFTSFFIFKYKVYVA